MSAFASAWQEGSPASACLLACASYDKASSNLLIGYVYHGEGQLPFCPHLLFFLFHGLHVASRFGKGQESQSHACPHSRQYVRDELLEQESKP